MKRLVLSLAVCASSLAFAQDAGTGPDVARMPFTADSVKQVVTFHQEQIQGCYERTMAEKEKVVEGKLATSWTITAEGLVKNAKVLKKGTTVKDADLHRCVEAVLLSMTFPSPGANKEVPIEYPFNLKPVR
jgi:hypothetical protein